MAYFNCLENIKINFLLLIAFIILVIYMLIKTYKALINNIALHRENKIIKRGEKAFDYWFSNLIQLFFGIVL